MEYLFSLFLKFFFSRLDLLFEILPVSFSYSVCPARVDSALYKIALLDSVVDSGFEQV